MYVIYGFCALDLMQCTEVVVLDVTCPFVHYDGCFWLIIEFRGFHCFTLKVTVVT